MAVQARQRERERVFSLAAASHSYPSDILGPCSLWRGEPFPCGQNGLSVSGAHQQKIMGVEWENHINGNWQRSCASLTSMVYFTSIQVKCVSQVLNCLFPEHTVPGTTMIMMHGSMELTGPGFSCKRRTKNHHLIEWQLYQMFSNWSKPPIAIEDSERASKQAALSGTNSLSSVIFLQWKCPGYSRLLYCPYLCSPFPFSLNNPPYLVVQICQFAARKSGDPKHKNIYWTLFFLCGGSYYMPIKVVLLGFVWLQLMRWVGSLN